MDHIIIYTRSVRFSTGILTWAFYYNYISMHLISTSILNLQSPHLTDLIILQSTSTTKESSPLWIVHLRCTVAKCTASFERDISYVHDKNRHYIHVCVIMTYMWVSTLPYWVCLSNTRISIISPKGTDSTLEAVQSGARFEWQWHLHPDLWPPIHKWPATHFQLKVGDTEVVWRCKACCSIMRLTYVLEVT